jgi:hypothetical protein
VAALRSARKFLTSLGSPMLWVTRSWWLHTLISTWWTLHSWSLRRDRSLCTLVGICTPFTTTAAAGGGPFSAASNGRGEDRARFEDGEPSPSDRPSSSAKTSKAQSLPRLSARPGPLRLRLRLPEGLAMESPSVDRWSCLSSSNVAHYRSRGFQEPRKWM